MNAILINIYNGLQKDRRKLLIQSLIFIFFLIGVNIFAWFTYVSRAETSIDANVASWDVEFNANGVSTSKVNINISDMKPGMLDFKHEVLIHNLGEVPANFSYELNSLVVFGKYVDIGDGTSTLSKFESRYPFIIKTSSTKELLSAGDYLAFTVTANWAYEDDKYFQLDNLYTFDSSVNYYRLVNGAYVLDMTINASNFEANRENLYLEKDDADNYFGEKCGEYEKSSGMPCIQMGIKLKVEQIKESN